MVFRPAFRNHSIAASGSPPVSINACLHSIIGKPVRSRRAFTIAAVISGIALSHSAKTHLSVTRLAFRQGYSWMFLNYFPLALEVLPASPLKSKQ
jgi:hypothetical protein